MYSSHTRGSFRRENVCSSSHTHTQLINPYFVTSAMTCQLIPVHNTLCVSGYLEHVLGILHFHLKYLLMRQTLTSWNNQLP